MLSQAVRSALTNGEPVVALESTILTHGLPRPINFNIGTACEEAVSRAGAVPATIFIRDGRIHVGVEPGELAELCEVTAAKKVSRRDFGGVLVGGGWGGTTVAGTLIAASLAGIPLLATGGLGGVHRGAESTMDISADLTELSRTPVSVVCAGVKKILDIKRTLEVLETNGVGVYTIGEDAAFPDFYLRDSGFTSPGGAIDVSTAAEIIRVNRELNLKSGTMFANPVPVDCEGDGRMISLFIEQAIQEASDQLIFGAASTPFILSRLAELSDGKTVEINSRLVENNAYVGGLIATALAQKQNR